MPRYYFHLMSATQTCDCGFLDMSDDEAAREEAELEGYDVLDDHAGGDWSNWTVRVTDEAGRHVTSVRIGDLLKSVNTI